MRNEDAHIPMQRGALSAAMLPAKDRLNNWRDLFGRQFLRLDVDPLDEQPFRYDIEYLSLPGMNLSAGEISSVKCTRTPELIDDQNDDIILLIPRRGEMELRERGREMRVHAGDALVRRSSETAETLSTSGEYWTLSIPNSSVEVHAGDLSRFGFAVIPGQDPTLRLLSGYLRHLMAETRSGMVPDLSSSFAGDLAARHVQEVVGAMLGGTRAIWDEGGGLPAVRLAAIDAAIARNITKTDFSIHDVARQLDLSPGYIRKLLATRGQRFSDLLRSARLDLAHRFLSGAHARHVEITAIALHCGFNDLSYFNRCFKQRFGLTPGEVRHMSGSSG